MPKLFNSLTFWLRQSMFANLFTSLVLFSGLAIAGIVPVVEFLGLMAYEQRLPSIFELESLVSIKVGFLIFVGLFGFFRVMNSHPLCNSRYLDWLKRTPWQWGISLPKQPIHFTWQDGILVLAVTLFCAWINPFDYLVYEWIRPLAIFLGAMMVLQTIANGISQQYQFVYAVLFIIPLGLMSKHLVVIEITVIIAYLVSYSGTARSLSDLTDQVSLRNLLTTMLPKRSPETTVILGKNINKQSLDNIINASPITWPYKNLFQEPSDVFLRFTLAWLHSSIASTWLFMIYLYSKDNSQPRDASAFAFMAMMGVLGLAMIRFIPNGSVICSKFCLGKRVVDKKLIVWNHDRLLIEPLVVILSGALPILVGLYFTDQFWDSKYLLAGIMIGIPVEIFMLHTFGKPAKQLFYTGEHITSAGRMNNKIVYAKLNSPGD